MVSFEKLTSFSKKIQKKLNPKLEFIALHFVFIFGLASTALIAKLIDKRFLEKKTKNSSWKKYNSSNNYRKMY